MPRDLDVVEDICKATFADPEVAVVPEDVIDVDRTKKIAHRQRECKPGKVQEPGATHAADSQPKLQQNFLVRQV